MAFIQSCFIKKNTPELRKKLEELGYKFSGADHIELDCIVTLPHHNTFSVFAAYHFNIYDDSFKTVWKEYIDCGTNEELFLAVAALRDDSDYMQWFVSPKTHTKRLSGCFGQLIGMDGHYQEIVGYEWHRHENKDNALTKRLNTVIQMEVEDMKFLPHKATVEEIIEHFKDK